jgi:hypothetical protein
MVDRKMIISISEQTNLYSVQTHPDRPANVTSNENEHFVGSLFYMSIHGLPCIKCSGGQKHKFHK